MHILLLCTLVNSFLIYFHIFSCSYVRRTYFKRKKNMNKNRRKKCVSFVLMLFSACMLVFVFLMLCYFLLSASLAENKSQNKEVFRFTRFNGIAIVYGTAKVLLHKKFEGLKTSNHSFLTKHTYHKKKKKVLFLSKNKIYIFLNNTME